MFNRLTLLMTRLKRKKNESISPKLNSIFTDRECSRRAVSTPIHWAVVHSSHSLSVALILKNSFSPWIQNPFVKGVKSGVIRVESVTTNGYSQTALAVDQTAHRIPSRIGVHSVASVANGRVADPYQEGVRRRQPLKHNYGYEKE